jgi:hypothetical protein
MGFPLLHYSITKVMSRACLCGVLHDGSLPDRFPFGRGAFTCKQAGEQVGNPIEIHFTFTSGRGVSGTRGLDHRHDASLQGLGQVGPGFDHGGQVGVILGGGRYYANAGSATGSAQTPGTAGLGHDEEIERSGFDVARIPEISGLAGLGRSDSEYRRWESNPHGRSRPEDFKSSASAAGVASATRSDDVGTSRVKSIYVVSCSESH